MEQEGNMIITIITVTICTIAWLAILGLLGYKLLERLERKRELDMLQKEWYEGELAIHRQILED